MTCTASGERISRVACKLKLVVWATTCTRCDAASQRGKSRVPPTAHPLPIPLRGTPLSPCPVQLGGTAERACLSQPGAQFPSAPLHLKLQLGRPAEGARQSNHPSEKAWLSHVLPRAIR